MKNRRKIVKISTRIILEVFSILMFISVTIFSFAPSLLFYPWFDEASYNALQNHANVEELVLSTHDYTLDGWMLHNVDGEAPLLLYFGGNGENASTRMLFLLENEEASTMFQKYNVAIVDYPGYGKSNGFPSEDSLKKMGLTAYDALSSRKDVDSNCIVILGYSIGTGVSNYVASNRNVAGLIEMAPYADGYDLYNSMINIFHGPLRLLVGFRMESVSFAKNISVQPLILASQSDGMIPYESTVRLSCIYPAGCRFVTIQGIHHNDFWDSRVAYQSIAAYLSEVLENARK